MILCVFIHVSIESVILCVCAYSHIVILYVCIHKFISIPGVLVPLVWFAFDSWW